MKKIILTIPLLVILLYSYSQYDISEYYSEKGNDTSFMYYEDTKSAEKNYNLNLEAGSSFGSIGNGGSVFSTYIKPSWQYRFSPKFKMNFGTIVMRQSFNDVSSFYSPYETSSFNGFVNRVFVFAEGTYQVSKRVTVSGAGMKEVTPRMEQSFNPYFYTYMNQGVSMHINYKINDHMSIGAGFSMSEGPYSPYYNNYYSPFGNPYNSPFHSPYRTGFYNPW